MFCGHWQGNYVIFSGGFKFSKMNDYKTLKYVALDVCVDGILLDVAEERLKAGESITDFRFNKKRVRVLQGDEGDLTRQCKVQVDWRKEILCTFRMNIGLILCA